MEANPHLVLVVDNEKDVVDLVKLGLDIEGFKCLEAYSGRSALEVLKKNPNIDIILLDIMMEDMDGYETLKEIRNNKVYDNIPVIMLTAKPEDKNAEITFSVGADDYISKPFTFDVLLARINKSIRQRNKKIQYENKYSEIEKVKNTFELILDNAGFGLMLISDTGNILLINKYLRDLLGVYKINTHDNYKSFSEKNNLPESKLISKISNSEKIEKINYTHTLKIAGQNKLFYFIEEYPVFNRLNEIIGIVQIYVDITEYKKIEELMVHSEKLSSVGQLAASLAHEVNNPLTLLSGILQMFKASSELPEKYKDDIGLMFDITERLKNLIEKMLILSRKHDLNENIEELNASLLIDESIRLVDYKIKSMNMNIEKKCKPNEAYIIKVSKWSIIHCFVNILINAIDASELKSENIIIEIKKTKQNILITFRDFGKGITEDEQSNLFTPFFTTKQTGKGTGLGLYIVKHILSSYNAKIDIHNAVDKVGGVEVVLCFPV